MIPGKGLRMRTSRELRTIVTSALVTLALLLGASTAHAQVEVILDGSGNATGILNLPVTDENTQRTTIYNVDFVVDDVYGVYGADLVFDFPDDETILVAVASVNMALTDSVPLPERVGSSGSDQFFIGNTFEDPGFIAAAGGEFYVTPDPPERPDADTWSPCDRNEQSSGQQECIASVATISLNELVMWANFTETGGPPPTLPEISLMPTALSPAVLEGENPADQQVSVGNSGEGTLDYTITDDQTWLSLSSSGGMVAPGSSDLVTVSYVTSALGQGIHQATITVTDPSASNDPQTIDVTLLVTELPAIALSETMLMPQAVLGSDPLPNSFTVTNSGGLLLFYDVSVDVPWMFVNPVSGQSAGEADTIDVVYDTTDLLEGVFNGTITVSDPDAANNPQTIDVVLTIAAGTLGDTGIQLRNKVNTIPDLTFDPAGTYTKPGYDLILPQTGIAGNSLAHNGGSHTFTTSESTVTYGNWTFEIRSTCAANEDPCLVQTDNGAPWALRTVDSAAAAGTAVMVFTASGAQAFNLLAGGDPDFHFEEEDEFGTAKFVIREPSTVITNMGGSNATRIENLDIDGQLYDVDFIVSTAMDLYGDFSSPTFPFVGTSNIEEANEAILAALNGNPAVETAGPNASDTYSFGQDKELLLDQIVLLVQGTYISSWQEGAGSAVWDESTTYADFTIVPVPEPGTAAGSTAALCALGLIRLAARRRRR
jgi:hypothetical protein